MRAQNTGGEDVGTFRLVEPGIHEATVFKVEDGFSGNGNPMITLDLCVEDAGGRVRMQARVTSTPATVGQVGAALRAFGTPPQIAAWEAGQVIEFDPAPWCGRCCQVVVKHEVYQGTTRNAVDALLPAKNGQRPLTFKQPGGGPQQTAQETVKGGTPEASDGW